MRGEDRGIITHSFEDRELQWIYTALRRESVCWQKTNERFSARTFSIWVALLT